MKYLIQFSLKTICIILLCIVSWGSRAIFAEEITYEASFAQEKLSFAKEGEYQKVAYGGLFSTDTPGAPELPYQLLQFALPQGMSVDRIKIVTDEKKVLPGEFLLYPSSRIALDGVTIEPVPPDGNIYQSSVRYPTKPVVKVSEGLSRGIPIATIKVYPLEYSPAAKRLALHKRISFKIVLKDSSFVKNGVTPPSISPLHASILQKTVANPEAINSLVAKAGQTSLYGEIDYLIITSQALINQNAFAGLINEKNSRGMIVVTESVENITLSEVGRDLAEKIRHYIQRCYQDHGLTWVLLGGDTDIVPARFVRIQSEMFDPDGDGREDDFERSQNNPPSDMYYSCLDGNWDGNQNGIFGEPGDQVDYIPDVFVGRAPVITVKQAQVFVDKVLAYKNNVSGYANRLLFMGAADSLSSNRNAETYTKQIVDEYLSDNYLANKYFPVEGEDAKPKAGALINSARSNIIAIMDHGSAHGLAIGSTAVDRDFFTYCLHNKTTPSILYTLGCLTAAIDDDCLGEHWIRSYYGGGPAYIGNSRKGGSPSILLKFYQLLFGELKEVSKIGVILDIARNCFGENLDNANYMNRRNTLQIILLGDPEMNIDIQSTPPFIRMAGKPIRNFLNNYVEEQEILVKLMAMNGDFSRTTASLESLDPYVVEITSGVAGYPSLQAEEQAYNNEPFRIIITGCPINHLIRLPLSIKGESGEYELHDYVSFYVYPLISGYVKDEHGIGIGEVALEIKGDNLTDGVICYTDWQGYYSQVLPNGSYTITPDKYEYIFTPSMQRVEVNGADIEIDEITGKVPVYHLIGYIQKQDGNDLDGVALTINGSRMTTTVTSRTGKYHTYLPNGTYTITPSLNGYTFTPASLSVQISGKDVWLTDNNPFVGYQFCTLSGYVRDISGNAISGTSFTITIGNQGTVVTDTNGYYSKSLPNGTYTVTPSSSNKIHYYFNPQSLSVRIENNPSSNNNFIARRSYLILGYIQGAAGNDLNGATITIKGPEGTATVTSRIGKYYTYLPSGPYTITPSLSGYTFAPASLTVSISGGNLWLMDEKTFVGSRRYKHSRK